MSGHAAAAVRRSTGWQRWYAKCWCGWKDTEARGREQAEAAAERHKAETSERA